MNVIPPPTDNLYKFCAITGVTMVLLATWYSLQQDDDIRGRLLDTYNKLNRAAIEQRYLEVRIRDLNKLVTDLTANVTKQQIQEERNDSFEVSSQEIKTVLKEVVDSQKDLELTMVDIGSIDTRTSFLIRRLIIVCIVSFLALIVGCLLAWYGFVNWYRRIQVYQDKAIRKNSGAV